MPYSEIFEMQVRKAVVIFEIITVEFVQNKKIFVNI